MARCLDAIEPPEATGVPRAASGGRMLRNHVRGGRPMRWRRFITGPGCVIARCGKHSGLRALRCGRRGCMPSSASCWGRRTRRRQSWSARRRSIRSSDSSRPLPASARSARPASCPWSRRLIGSARSDSSGATAGLHRDALEFRLGSDGRRRLDQGACVAEPGPLAARQPGAQEHLRWRCDDGDHAAQQGSHLHALRATRRRRHQSDAREAVARADDRGNLGAHVERRGGLRPGTSTSIDEHARRPGETSVRRAAQKAILRSRNREERSHAAPCVAAELSIREIPGLRRNACRPDG